MAKNDPDRSYIFTPERLFQKAYRYSLHYKRGLDITDGRSRLAILDDVHYVHGTDQLMSVFTNITEEQLAEYLSRFNFGPCVSYEGIASGVENTNYIVNTKEKKLVLTLVEQHEFDQSQWYVELMRHVCHKGFPTPQPIVDRGGESLTTLAGRPAVLYPFVSGIILDRARVDHIHQLGTVIARLHRLTTDYPSQPQSYRDIDWCQSYYQDLAEKLDRQKCDKIESELANQRRRRRVGMPMGAVHSDIFRDNVFFLGDRLRCVIDFWHGGVDCLAYDLAVACNDWCWYDTRYEIESVLALLEGYQSVRGLKKCESDQWGNLLRRACLRFWLSRLQAETRVNPNALTTLKNPKDQENRLNFLIERRVHTLREFECALRQS